MVDPVPEEPSAESVLADLVARGVVEPPKAPKTTLPPPIECTGGISNIVIAQRG